ncbi:hypothetical protein [Flavobacterium quisquiliarum]|uniref:NVEALA protein n=1 Tax=Flavobacterium quisquiliarum TaxID=1834436 RepID=A0ABV8WA03_9FLAO|nr:hypothetical protein [Flavobacterium quisquiliarum]MBW1657275.1 hypothetical protein [Flavobacterium quisquiliarum]NWL00560.1 hypothetical protein [Flavobacterium collinsii]
MKKVLFTVFTIVGFSAFGFANNQGQACVLDNKLKETLAFLGSCEERQGIATNLCKEMGCSDFEAYFYGAAEWGRCMGGN